ncbi:hypothetical protein [Actinomadura sp. NEAU-AAG7]|uniref:hypothetical protein n=1 Tax=Actinomadura sp. NEAU-AAG7 TaxID=2839640 RepID=UPI001BE3F2AB|nr:hypothetical protein [Actinomadura sp. NEAU-AAG7]MBT2211362.1 hypothetical protein [Actinomadura sp. NEAU-AAG7]
MIAVFTAGAVTFAAGWITLTDAGGGVLRGLGLLESTQDRARGFMGSKSLVLAGAPRWGESAAMVTGERMVAPTSNEAFYDRYNEKADDPRVAGSGYSEISFGLKAQRAQVVEITQITAVEVKRIPMPDGTLLWSPPGGGDGVMLTLGLAFRKLPPRVRARTIEPVYSENAPFRWKDLGPYPGHGKGNTKLKDQETMSVQLFVDTLSVPTSFKVAISYTVGGKVQPPLVLGNEGDERRPFRIVPLCSSRRFIAEKRAYTIDLGASRPGVVPMKIGSIGDISLKCSKRQS